MIARLLDLWAAEPVAATAMVTTAVDLAVAFGAPINAGAKQTVVGFVSALGLFFARKQVTPNASVRARLRHPTARR